MSEPRKRSVFAYKNDVVFVLTSPPATSNLYPGEAVPIPTFWLVSTVTAVVVPLVCNVKELALFTIGVVTDVVPLKVVNVPAAAAVPPMAGGLAK